MPHSTLKRGTYIARASQELLSVPIGPRPKWQRKRSLWRGRLTKENIVIHGSVCGKATLVFTSSLKEPSFSAKESVFTRPSENVSGHGCEGIPTNSFSSEFQS